MYLHLIYKNVLHLIYISITNKVPRTLYLLGSRDLTDY